MGVNVRILCVCFVLFMAIEAIEVVPNAAPMDSILENKNIFKKRRSLPPSRSRPIDYTFKLPTAPTSWPEGNGFAGGILDLGGLQVSQASTFRKVWGAYDGGLDNQGASVYEPIGIPEGFSMLGSYSQPNDKPLFGYVLVAKNVFSSTTNSTLKPPVDYTTVSTPTSASYAPIAYKHESTPYPPYTVVDCSSERITRSALPFASCSSSPMKPYHHALAGTTIHLCFRCSLTGCHFFSHYFCYEFLL